MVKQRFVPIEIDPKEFKQIGYHLVDQISEFLESIRNKPVTKGESPAEIRALLGNSPLPDHGREPSQLLEEATRLLMEHSLFNGHQHFYGYITSSAAPIGALGDFLA